MLGKTLCVLGVSLLAVSSPVSVGGAAGEQDGAPSPESGTNVNVTITVGEMRDQAREPLKSFQLIAVDGGPEAKLLAGFRVPIPVTTFQASSPPREIVPMTSYTYQKIGFTAEVGVKLLRNGKIRLDAEIEDSSVSGQETPARIQGQPIIETYSQQIRAVLEDGVPLKIIRSDDPATSLYLEIRADVLG